MRSRIEHRVVVNGRVKWLREKAYLEFDESGGLLGGFGITEDITERKLVEQERAEQARLKDEFLALLGHELRNPLAAISTALQLLSDGATPQRRGTLIDIAGRQVAVLRRLVDDLLDLARVTRGLIQLQKEPIELSDFLQRMSAASSVSVASRSQELITRLPAGRVRFMADTVRLEQIVTNLLSNASKYTQAGGTVELSGAQEGPEVVIRCKDNGRGIPPGMQRMIFDPFTRVTLTSQSDVPGVGIDLSLVKRLVELHGGTVGVESGGPGMGSEFTVRMPLVEPPSALCEARKTRLSPSTRRGVSVVIVEDNPDVAQILEFGLEQAGHEVSVFADGPAALSGMAGLKPDAILLDIGLPGMDGYELAARLRQNRELQHAMFVGLSGFKRKATDDKDDFDHYFVKPVDLNELLRLLDVLRRRIRSRAAASGRRQPSGRRPA
ncbi:MAG: hybrid sensor histidine kinase/response regulator [Acidobacteriales bacterium]|nr:hybrid sensor histidine kinase/response regulator [Terriglobales bacterium]